MSPPIPPPIIGNQTPENLSMQCGRYFRFALPAGWLVQENTNLICINDPAGEAAIMSVGLVGMLQPMMPDQFVRYALHMHQMQLLQLVPSGPIAPQPGCTHAAAFDLVYACNGVTCRGVVSCHVAMQYGQCNATMTLAAAREPLWPRYTAWLPRVASHVGPAGAHTYMAGQVAADNLRNSIDFGRRLQEVNDYSAQLHAQTVAERAASQDRINFHFRENLGNVATYQHPYENRTVEMPTTHSHYWINRAGDMRGTDDPGYDPNMGSTHEWTRMQRTKPE